jgi:hypothetical protein
MGEAFLGMRVPEVAVALECLAGESDQAELRPPPEELAEVPPAGAFLAELFGSPALVARCFASESDISRASAESRSPSRDPALCARAFDTLLGNR